MDIKGLNLLGAGISVFILIICCLIFISRLVNYNMIEFYLGIILLLTAFPLLYLLFTAPQFQRPPLYYIQLIIMLGFLLIELFLDYILKADFRSGKSLVIPYVMLFFAGTGGMIGVASLSGKTWSILSIELFIIMTILAFVQHFKTGL